MVETFEAIVRKNSGLVKAGKIASKKLAPYINSRVKIQIEKVKA